MKGDRFGDYEHLLRVVGLFAAGLVVFLLLKAVLVPASFGLYGHYRAAALEENRARPVAFAGHAACEECHADVVEARKGSKHARVSCEACHGALARHAAGDESDAKPARPTAALCLTCHAPSVAKPAAFPQVSTKDHAEPGTCLECHKPHSPKV
jgi:hypothetical protein